MMSKRKTSLQRLNAYNMVLYAMAMVVYDIFKPKPYINVLNTQKYHTVNNIMLNHWKFNLYYKFI